MSPKSTIEVAELAGIHPATLERWLSNGLLRPPKELRVGQKVFRDWTEADIEKIRKLKGKQKRGPKKKRK
jgi:DNA-binding transcriptional MerR regulator